MQEQGTSSAVRGRFWDKADKSAGPDGCWIWRASLTEKGYGRVRFGGRACRAHRVAYELEVGPIPDGLTIDHLCGTRACVNPAHLEAVTQRENVMRGDTIPARNAAKTHCPRGHAYDAANTQYNGGKRFCRECGRIRDAARY